MTTMTRRSFCGAVAATLLAPTALAGESIGGPVMHCFVEESGQRGYGPVVVGVLRTTAPDVHAAAIDDLRRRHRYFRELKYTSTDRNKLGFAAAVLDYFAGADGLAFNAILVSDAGSSVDPRARRAAIYRQALAGSLGESPVVHVRHDPRRPDLFLARELGVATLVHGKESPSDLTQLAGFLSGCVYGKVTDIAHQLKRDLIARAGKDSELALIGGRKPLAVTRFTV